MTSRFADAKSGQERKLGIATADGSPRDGAANARRLPRKRAPRDDRGEEDGFRWA